jgi:hypothetical protein
VTIAKAKREANSQPMAATTRTMNLPGISR